MNDEIIAYLRDHAEGVGSREIAERFLKFKSPDERLAHVAVTGILGKDCRAVLDDGGLWHAQAETGSTDAVALTELPWAAVTLLHQGRQLIHLSAWSVLPEPHLLVAEWLVDPATLSTDDQQRLRTATETPYDAARHEDILVGLAEGLGERIPVFVNAREEALLNWHCATSGTTLTDDTMLLSNLLRAAEHPVPRPLDLETCAQQLLGRRPFGTDAAHRGRLLAECIAELLEALSRRGVENREQLEQRIAREVAQFDFSGKHFDQQTLTSLTTGPGVYGFQNGDRQYIYIGKARNIRRRVSGYFRRTEESPAKLERLRSEAVELTVHPCGSELESLLLEYRLIRKYAPSLNTQTQTSERTGSYRPLEDSVVLLPHADPRMGMSLWLRKGQKILLRSFHADFREFDVLSTEIDTFFFGPPLPTADTDFPEQEIAERWIRRHMETLVLVAAYQKASGHEVAKAMRLAWREEFVSCE